MNMNNKRFTIEIEQEVDGRFIAEVQELPGVLCYGVSREEVLAKVEALALRVIADRLDAAEEVASRFSSIAFTFS